MGQILIGFAWPLVTLIAFICLREEIREVLKALSYALTYREVTLSEKGLKITGVEPVEGVPTQFPEIERVPKPIPEKARE